MNTNEQINALVEKYGLSETVKQEIVKIVNDTYAWNSQLNQSRVMPRYFVDIRGGCGAVRDKWHESYDEDYPGLHGDTPDVVEYKHGYADNGVWNMKDEDVKYLNYLCERLNNEV